MHILSPLMCSVLLEISQSPPSYSKGRNPTRVWTPDPGATLRIWKLFLISLRKFHPFHVHNVIQLESQCSAPELFLCVASFSMELCPQIVVTSALLNSNLCLLIQWHHYVLWVLLPYIAVWKLLPNSLGDGGAHLICFPSSSDYALSLGVVYLWSPLPRFCWFLYSFFVSSSQSFRDNFPCEIYL